VDAWPPDFVTDVISTGPFWFSALKFDVSTLKLLQEI